MINFKLNGVDVKSSADQSEPLLHILSNDFKLNGQKFGCNALALAAIESIGL